MLKSIIKGFSLLELVVVLAVMGTLAAVAVPAFSAVTDNSSSGALLASAKGLVDAANGNAQSDKAEPGRGVKISDISIAGTSDAIKSTDGTTITVYGQKDQCIVISLTPGASQSKDVLTTSAVRVSTGTGAIAERVCTTAVAS